MENLQSKQILGVKVTTSSRDRILEYIESKLKKGGEILSIVTPNPEIIMYARSHPDFKRILDEADIALPDGVGISVASHLLGLGRIGKVPGVEFMEELVKLTAELNNEINDTHKNVKKTYSIGLFGGLPGVAELASLCLQKKYSGTEISIATDKWDSHNLPKKKMSILFVALGHPKQEKWIYEHLSEIPADVVMGVGGSFDFISRRVRRAPIYLQKAGLEWLFRLVNQPWRWKRQLALISFGALTVREMITSRSR